MAKKDSPTYIAAFALGVCLVCSLLVSSAAIFLKERQESNATVARQEKVLSVAGLMRPGEKLSNEEIGALFEDRLIPQLIELESGEPVAEVEGESPAEYAPMKYAKSQDLKAPKNAAQVRYLPEVHKIYYQVSEKGRVKKIILPIQGYGLWGMLYGYLAMEADGVTIAGITYYEHAETPGLGGEVDNPSWKGLWKGKKAFDEGAGSEVAEVAIEVAKNAQGEHQVDALSGATITSRGVTKMMEFWLGERGFGPFLAGVREHGVPDIVGVEREGAVDPAGDAPGAKSGGAPTEATQ